MTPKKPAKKAPAKRRGERSKRSGRTSTTTTHDSGWLLPALGEVKKASQMAFLALGDAHEAELDFAVIWAWNWLASYDAGHCSLLDCLVSCRKGLARVPAPWSRLIIGVIAHKATLATPKTLGEHRAKTPPAVVRMVGESVQARMFDESGNQVATTAEAVADAVAFLKERDLLSSIPAASTVETWWKEWRAQEKDAGRPPPEPRSGRPRKTQQ